jgi:NAD(P)-dependent dehydrogenase (short-subunit alcohol dehydrogenase family)
MRVALVTGAANGIGRASAEAFAGAGYAVVLLDRDGDGARAAAAALGEPAIAVECDVSDWDDVRRAFDEVDRAHGRLDALHANAGSEGYYAFEEMPIEELRRQVDVNLMGHLYCLRAALPLLAAAGGGSIVLTASVQGHLTLPGCVPYAAAKAGLMAVARALAVELGPKGIRVNTVSPGTIATPMLDRSLEGMAAEEVEGFLGQVRAANALGRIGEPRDIANVVVFLCSEGAAYVTGEDVVVDGGYLRVKKF